MAQEPDAHLETLPTEVLLQILTQISDIHCLWNLLISSPAASRVFNQYSHDIFWASVFDSIIPAQTQDVIRFILSLRAGAFRSTPLDQLVRKIRDREAGIVLGQSSELGYSLPNMDNTAKPSLSVLRSVVAVASQVHALSRLCIDHYLASLAAATTERRLDTAPEWLANDQPSWVEEQRTIRAFWRIQLVLELNFAERTSQVQSSAEGNKSLEKLEIETFYDSNTSNLKVAFHEVMSAVDFLKGSGFCGNSSSISLSNRLPSPNRPAKDISPSTAGMPLNPATRRSSLVLPADGLWIVDSMGRNAHSPIKYAGFGPYRNMGFAIWDRERLAKMGLASPPGHGRVTGLGSYFSLWLKLLNPQEMCRAGERMREAECRGGRLDPLQPMIQDNAS
ncbi:hypothetical protein ColTof4_02529 [Colletotrichum tofieldiae]|uniref:F-box domain-containing protein n=1 Tax=Colletotrichum tofieldiae TaxID=708197 RepID=A0A166YIW4_9PEZI|nr:hypothetical protein CT0861_06372 [Colletotrichum tofieldiae]GKT61841.1 hypothetical protein ColTof3_09180 [Colletotrichum tofieldiae]GKT70106.1 hypothetical protein ColTof4_02529 [Colletotrichum tofieldiae]GKT93144.1 hypothetical protein Ct61P_10994 [Colletotrichum tofieldiae]